MIEFISYKNSIYHKNDDCNESTSFLNIKTKFAWYYQMFEL